MGAARPLEWTLIPTDWGGGRGAARPPEWRKTPVGAATEWAGESSGLRTTRPPERQKEEWAGESICLRTTRPPERQMEPGEMKPWDPSQRPNTDRGRTDVDGGEGTKTHPPPEQPGGKDPTAERARSEADGRRRRPRRRRQRQERAGRGTRLSTLTTQTAPRLKTASTRTTSTTIWLWRRQREARPARGLPQERTAMGPQNTVQAGQGQRRGTKSPSAQDRRRNPKEERRRRAPPPRTVGRA